jgi:thiamine-monophosphate kinase
LTRLSEIGEFGLVRKIQALCRRSDGRVKLGIGDDGALLRIRPGFLSVVASDSLVEGVHFDLKYTPPESLGWKSLAVNLSDLAAMAADPVACVIGLGIPDAWTVETVESLYLGMERCGREYGCVVAGGDTVRSPETAFVSVTVVGEVEDGAETRRDTARPGDLICVTGELGGARTGLEVLSSGEKGSWAASAGRFLEPRPRIAEARHLNRTFGVTSMIDISDGLGSELGRLCEASRCGCRVSAETIPVANEARRWAQAKRRDVFDFAMTSGEEYELLFTVDPVRFSESDRRKEPAGSVPFTVIGEIREPSEGMRILDGGRERPWIGKGWDHFNRGGRESATDSR